MPPPMDLSLYIPVICTQVDASKYNGKCFMEAISKVQKLNGESISSNRGLTKADFTTSDLVVIKLNSRDYTGIVDFSADEEIISKRVDSPAAGSPPSVQPQAEAHLPAPVLLMKETPAESPIVATATDVATESVATATAETRSRKSIREDYPLPTLIVPKLKKRRNTDAEGFPRKPRICRYVLRPINLNWSLSSQRSL